MQIFRTLVTMMWLGFALDAFAADPISPTSPAVKVPKQLPAPNTCTSKNYACPSGYTCSLDTTGLGASNNSSLTLLYSCKSTAPAPQSCGLCPQGWQPQSSGATDGTYQCKPPASACGGYVAVPALGGHYCGIFLSG